MAAVSKIFKRISNPTLSSLMKHRFLSATGGSRRANFSTSSSSSSLSSNFGPPEEAMILEYDGWAPRHVCDPFAVEKEIKDEDLPGYIVRIMPPIKPLSYREMYDLSLQTLSKALGTTSQEALKKIYLFSDSNTGPGFCAKIDKETADKLKGMDIVFAVYPDEFYQRFKDPRTRPLCLSEKSALESLCDLA